MTTIVEASQTENDDPAPTIVEQALFTDRITTKMIRLLERDARNLLNPDLRTFYAPDRVAQADAADKYAADVLKRQELGLDPVSEQVFFNQINADGRDLFVQILSRAGLELEIENDLVSDSELTPSTDTGPITPDSVRTRLQHRHALGDHLHLLEEEPLTLADTTLEIQNRINRIKQYLRSYLV